METQDLASLIMNQFSADNPIYYANLVKATRSEQVEALKEMLPQMKERLKIYEQVAETANDFRKQVSGEGYARRKKDSKKVFEGLDKQSDSMKNYAAVDISVILSSHFANIVNIYRTLVQGADLISKAKIITLDETLNNWSSQLKEGAEYLGVDRVDKLTSLASQEASDVLKGLALEQKVNRGASASFSQGLMMLEKVPLMYESYLQSQSRNFESYYHRLSNRHSEEGITIVNYKDSPSPTLTDVAILIWENIDKVGEIESGHSKDEISAYTLHRANAMINAAKYEDVWAWIVAPEKQLLSWAKTTLPIIKNTLKFVISIKDTLGEPTWKLYSKDPEKNYRDFEDVIDSLDLSQIFQRPPERAFSKTEKFAMEHKNKSIESVAKLLIEGSGITHIVDEILKLKIEEREFFVMENSFFVCRVGTGNMFTGEAPGGIEVIPGEKPYANLNKIWGNGFDEIRDFIDGMEEAKKWAPLFLATSPSGSTDKNNVLLVGPQGCGKSQVLRSLGADNDSISIFAVGSDFLTAWMGESQKNPKRLFNEAVKLHKTSGRPVHILIDEIDMVLNKDRKTSGTPDLSLEFQNLMDGVVSYPGISIWGATNHLERIPTPMIRRFAKVLVVGELTREDSNAILRYYIENFLPCEKGGFSEQQYDAWSEMFDGATGDVLRKGVDQVWLSLMRNFIKEHEEVADNIINFIHEEYGEHFDVSELSDDDRSKIKDMVAATETVVTADLVTSEFEKLLDNAAIRQQIQVAKDTYKKAKVRLQKAKAKNKGLGF